MLRDVSKSACSAYRGQTAPWGLKSAPGLEARGFDGVRLPSAQHRSEHTIPTLCRDAVVAARKSVMVAMMLQQGRRQKRGIVMGTMMDMQIPGVGDENASQKGASRDQVDDGEGQPYLPEDLVDTVLRPRVMNPVLDWRDTMQHKAMGDVFSERPCRQTATEQNSGNGGHKSRDGEQHDGSRSREDQFAEIDSDGHRRRQTGCLAPEPPSM